MKASYIVLFAGMVVAASGQAPSEGGTSTYREKVLYSFCGQANCTDGSEPFGGVIDVKGMLYSTTGAGGKYGSGSIFALNAKTGAERVLYSFCKQQNCSDGNLPAAGLLIVQGMLYGTTAYGGADCQYRNEPSGCGTIFSLDPNDGSEKVLHSFGAASGDGVEPIASLIAIKGDLYGTTLQGGAHEYGAVFVVDRKTGAEKVVYSFCSQQNCADGAYPRAGLLNVNGTLYGTTNAGGIVAGNCGGGCGTLFGLDPITGAETVLYSFCQQPNCADGEYSLANLIVVDRMLYGTTNAGGTYGFGTVFALDPKTGVETVLHSFDSGADGTYPGGGLVHVNGALYGTTTEGGGTDCGGLGCGTVFALQLSTDAEKVIYSFCRQQNCGDGQAPVTNLIDVRQTLYGTTPVGGKYGDGTVFSLKRRH